MASPEPLTPRLPQRWLLYAALGLVALAPSQLAYALDPRKGPFLGVADVLAGLLCLVALITALRDGKWRHLLKPPLAVWALLAVALLSLGHAVQPLRSVVEIAQYALYLVAVYMLFVNVLGSRERLRWALGALAVPTSLAVLWALVQYCLAPDPHQVAAGFTNCNTYSAYLALVLPLLLAAAFHTGRRDLQLWWYAVVALGLLTMLSGPLVWLTILLLAVLAWGRSGLQRWATLAALALFVALLPFALPRNYQAAVADLGNPYETELVKVPGGPGQAEVSVPVVRKRWLEWQPALNMMAANFVLGVGAGNYQARIGEYYGDGLPNVKKAEPDTNNLYLVVAGSMGFLGLVALVGIMAHFWRRAAALWLVADSALSRALATGLPAALAALILGNLFTVSFVRGIGIIIALLFAMTEVSARLTGPGATRATDSQGEA